MSSYVYIFPRGVKELRRNVLTSIVLRTILQILRVYDKCLAIVMGKKCAIKRLNLTLYLLVFREFLVLGFYKQFYTNCIGRGGC